MPRFEGGRYSYVEAFSLSRPVAGRERFARRVFLRPKPEKIDEFLSAMQERIYPDLKRERGMRRVYLLRDAAYPNDFISLTLWDSRDDAAEYESTGRFSANASRIRDLLIDDPVTSQFTVEYHAVSQALSTRAPARKRQRKATRAKRPVKRRRK